MAQTIEITATDKMSVALFLLSIVYCILLAVAPSIQTSPLGLLVATIAVIVWAFVFAKATENQSVYSLLNIPTGIIWISLISQAL